MDRLGGSLGINNRWLIGLGLIAAVALLALLAGHTFTHAAPANQAVHHSVTVTSSNASTANPVNTSVNTESSLNNTTSVSSTSSGQGAHTKVTVNGQDIPVPQNGSVTQTIPGDNGSVTNLNVSSQTGDATNGYNYSTSVNVDSVSSNSSTVIQGGQ